MKKTKKIIIEFLFRDLSRCLACQMSEKSLEDSLKHLKEAIQEVNLDIEVTKVPLSSEEEAKQHQYTTSPTIRINGKDIEEIILGQSRHAKTYCGSCSAVCGEDTECRTFYYDGKTYQYIPRKMIVEAIKKILAESVI